MSECTAIAPTRTGERVARSAPTGARGPGTGSRLPWFTEDPGTQLVVIATGLFAVVGSTTGQVVWILMIAVCVAAAVVGRPDGQYRA